MNRLNPGAPLHNRPNAAGQIGAANLWLILTVFLAGALMGAFWISHRRAAPPPAPILSTATLQVLARLNAPAEIRFYSMLDPTSAPDSMDAFSGRAARLLNAYQAASQGKVTVVLRNRGTNFDPQAALSDGIQPFRIGAGSDCYLGIAVCKGTRKEILPALNPEWESALESDVTRALSRLANTSQHTLAAPPAVSPPSASASDPAPGQPSAPEPEPIDTNALAEVRRIIPDIQAMDAEEGVLLLKEAARNELQAVVTLTEIKYKRAQDEFSQAQARGDEAAVNAAKEKLRQIREEKVQAIQKIADKTHARVEAFQRAKQ